MNRIRDFFTGPVNVVVYIFILLSAFTGFIFGFLGKSPEVVNSPIFHHGILFGANLWGALLMVASLVVLFGLFFQKKWLEEGGSMAAFMLWSFAAVSYLDGQYWLSFLQLVAYLMTFAYIYIASSTGILREMERNYSELKGKRERAHKERDDLTDV